MKDSFNITQLIDWLEGRLTQDEEKVVAAAVRADQSYQATVTWLRNFLNLSRSTVLMEPPAQLLRDAKANFRAFAQWKRKSGWLSSLQASLASDSWQRPALVGLRRIRLDVVPRQLVYRTDAADIVLNIQAGTDKAVFDLIGQVFPTDESDPSSFTVQLIRQEREAALSYTNQVGKFAWTGLAAGTYTLMIRGDQVEIIVADLELST
jgi:hypothetical protein